MCLQAKFIKIYNEWFTLAYFSRVVNEENEEEAPMRRSFSVEDLLDEVEKICYNASGTSKVRNTFTPKNAQIHVFANVHFAAIKGKLRL